MLDKSEQQYTDLKKSLEGELAKLNDLWLEEYRTIERVLAGINRADSPLKIVPQFKANKEAMRKHMQDQFRGSRIREATLQVLIDQYSDFGAMWRDWTNVAQQLGGSIETFSQYFDGNIEALLTWQVPNVFTIEYHGKALVHHSLGQRASALMLFVLSQRDNDVVFIDQPEDDLDNQTIYDDVIKLIRSLKPETQFIFATHNANIPVLGDAEQVIACRYQDEHISTVSGSIDCADIQKNIVGIMEGGAEAFERRKQVYEAETAELLSIIANGEDSKHQFKADFTNANAVAAGMVAFSNSKGGVLVIGVNDDGTIAGLDSGDMARLNQLISNAAS